MKHSRQAERIESVEAFVAFVDQQKDASEKTGNHVDFLFRGQRRDLPLLPKIARLDLRGEITNIEKLIIAEFRRTSLPLSEFRPENDWDLLALAQHHGLPTRLLDWTYSALAALWFTVHKPSHNQENGVVWILEPDVEDFRIDTEVHDPLSNKVTKIFRPKIMSRRISAQAGAFTVHRINEGGHIIRLETHKTFKNKLVKVVVPSQCFGRIRRGLNMLGVNSSTLFPDIDGLCAHLEWRYSYMDDEKQTRSALTSRST